MPGVPKQALEAAATAQAEQAKLIEQAKRDGALPSTSQHVIAEQGAQSQGSRSERELLNEIPGARPPVQQDHTADPSSSPPTDERKKSAAYWENRFNVLQGIERQKQAELVKLRDQVEQLSQRMATADAEREKQVRDAQLANPALERLIRERGGEGMEDDYLPVLQQQQQIIKTLTEQIEALKQSGQASTVVHEQQGAQVAQQAFYQGLITAFGGERAFTALNNALGADPWLDEVPAGMLHSRREALQEAASAGDLARAVEIFRAYEQARGQRYEPLSQPSAPSIEPQTAPRNGEGSGEAVPTLAQFHAFAEAMRQGHYRDKPQEAAQLQAYFQRHMSAGSIQQ